MLAPKLHTYAERVRTTVDIMYHVTVESPTYYSAVSHMRVLRLCFSRTEKG